MRLRKLSTLALAIAWATIASAASGPPPLVSCRPTGPCSVANLPPLSDPEVQGYLKSGLTSTLAVTLFTRSGAGQRGAATARVDVRFDPWDEVFHVRLVATDGSSHAERPKSAAEFEAWWRGLALAFPGGAPSRTSARVELSVIPFSEAEEADARRWYAEAARGGGAQRSASGFGDVLDTLTLTSIKRRGVLSFSWSVAVETAR